MHQYAINGRKNNCHSNNDQYRINIRNSNLSNNNFSDKNNNNNYGGGYIGGGGGNWKYFC